MRWYAVLFWLWLFGSLVILVVRRTSRQRQPEVEPTTVDPLQRVWDPPPPESGDDGPLSGATTTDPDRVGAPPLDAAPVDPPSDGPGPVDAARATAEPAAAPLRGVHAPTLGELLAGITLPHELVPLTQLGPTTDIASHLVVATDRASAETVREGLTDELERLGYSVVWTAITTALAEGPRGQVAVVVHPDGSTVLDGGTRRFPSATTGTVVVELRVA